MLDLVGGFMGAVGRIVRSHHERWDGGGYPDGLAGEQIPIEARIVTACDSYSAMTTTRSHRKAMPAADEELRASSGTQFDPTVVEALIATIGSDRPEQREGPETLPFPVAVTPLVASFAPAVAVTPRSSAVQDGALRMVRCAALLATRRVDIIGAEPLVEGSRCGGAGGDAPFSCRGAPASDQRDARPFRK